MNTLPKIPDEEKWASLSFMEQMANIGSEVGRTAKWVAKEKPSMAEGAFIRALDRIDLTIKVGRKGQSNRYDMLRELCTCRGVFCDAYLKKETKELNGLDKYFGHFARAVRR